MAQRIRTNFIWDYFSKVNGEHRIAKCKQCCRDLSYRTSITNLQTHLRIKHKESYKMYLSERELIWSSQKQNIGEISLQEVQPMIKVSDDQNRELRQHFTEKDEHGRVECVHCGQRLSVLTIFNLSQHLLRKHKDMGFQADSDEEGEEQPVSSVSQSDEYEEYEILQSDLEDNDIKHLLKAHTDTPRKSEAVVRQWSTKQSPLMHIINSINVAKKNMDQALVSVKVLENQNSIKQDELDEYDHFAHMIAAKIRKIQDMDAREEVMNSIQNMVYEVLKKNI